MIHPEGHGQAPFDHADNTARLALELAEAKREAATLRAENEALRLEVGDWINDQADKVARLADAEAAIARLRGEVEGLVVDLNNAGHMWRSALARAEAAEDALRTLRERLADAWDEGYRSGHSNAMRRMSDEPNAPTSPNPYRAALADSPTEQRAEP